MQDARFFVVNAAPDWWALKIPQTQWPHQTMAEILPRARRIWNHHVPPDRAHDPEVIPYILGGVQVTEAVRVAFYQDKVFIIDRQEPLSCVRVDNARGWDPIMTQWSLDKPHSALALDMGLEPVLKLSRLETFFGESTTVSMDLASDTGCEPDILWLNMRLTGFAAGPRPADYLREDKFPYRDSGPGASYRFAPSALEVETFPPPGVKGPRKRFFWPAAAYNKVLSAFVFMHGRFPETPAERDLILGTQRRLKPSTVRPAHSRAEERT